MTTNKRIEEVIDRWEFWDRNLNRVVIPEPEQTADPASPWPEDLAGLSMEEYSELRAKNGIKTTGAVLGTTPWTRPATDNRPTRESTQ